MYVSLVVSLFCACMDLFFSLLLLLLLCFLFVWLFYYNYFIVTMFVIFESCAFAKFVK
jgi:hypothetical protein